MRKPLHKESCFLPVVIFVVLFSQAPLAIGQDRTVPQRPREPIQLGPVTSAPAAPAVKPAQPSDVPQPTVVLKPGETPGIAVKELVTVEPKAVTWERLTAETVREPGLAKKVTITNNTGQLANLANVRSSNPLFAVEPPRVIEPGRRFELTVRVASALKPGNNIGTVDFSTGIATAPTFSIPVSVYVVPDVEATPSGVVVGSNRSSTQQHQVSVQNHTKTPVKLSSPQVSNPVLKVGLQESQPGMGYSLTVEIPAGSTLAPDGEKITLKTDSPTVPEIIIPVWEIRPPITASSPPAPLAVATLPTPAAAPGAPAPVVAPASPAPAAAPSSPVPAVTELPPPGPMTRVPINDVDPVTGKPLTPTSPTLPYKGYSIGFCCDKSAGYTGGWERMSERDKDAFVLKYVK
jgi:hypothetical protein